MLEGKGEVTNIRRSSRTRQSRIKNSPLRAIIGDVLPYEVPLAFSSAGLFRFLKHIEFEWIENIIIVKTLSDGEKVLLEQIFGRSGSLNETDRNAAEQVTAVPTQGNRQYFSKKKRKVDSRPFNFRVETETGKSRVLSVIHPASMIRMASFIDDYADSILYYSQRSRFSLRAPSERTQSVVTKDSVFRSREEKDRWSVEQFDLESSHFPSYFTYRKVNNINRFIDSEEYIALSKRYNVLARTDITRCFDSIYTHSMSWVVNGRVKSKEQTPKLREKHNFGNEFDQLMQSANDKETNGIVVGPEVSRIFAEIILQCTDSGLLSGLRESENAPEYGKDFEVRRYVDDYFIFARNESTAQTLLDQLQESIREFNLDLNSAKTEMVPLPWISIISKAKLEVNATISRRAKIELPNEGLDGAQVYLQDRTLLLELQGILGQEEIAKGHLTNFVLSALLRVASQATDSVLQRINEPQIDDSDRQQQSLLASLCEMIKRLLKLGFYFYSNSPSVSGSLKIAELAVNFQQILKDERVDYLQRRENLNFLRKEIIQLLTLPKADHPLRVNDLNLIDCLSHMKEGPSDQELSTIFDSRQTKIEQLDAFGVLVLLRALYRRDSEDQTQNSYFEDLCQKAKQLIASADNRTGLDAQATLLKLSLLFHPEMSPAKISDITGIKARDIRAVGALRRENKAHFSPFLWNVDKFYIERLINKSSQMVY